MAVELGAGDARLHHQSVEGGESAERGREAAAGVDLRAGVVVHEAVYGQLRHLLANHL